MPRPTSRDTDTPDHDSFLDIVANMVGILIILVMLVGVRVKNAPVTAAIPAPEVPAERQLQEELTAEQSIRGDVLKVADEIRDLQTETIVRGRQRDALATMVAAFEHEIESRRSQLDAGSQADFDLRRKLSEARVRLEQIERQRAQTEAAHSEPVLVESYPTPLSQTVEGREAHVQVRGGQVAFIPLDQLVEALRSDAGRQKYKLLDQPELTDTVGPVGGFRLKYVIRRHDMTPEMAMETGRGGSYAQLERWTLIPVSSQLGEPVDVALAEGSEFRQALSKYRPARSTITIWTYPDSFGSFRKLKKALYSEGFSVAARPLPHDIPISGSPEGSKSAKQ